MLSPAGHPAHKPKSSGANAPSTVTPSVIPVDIAIPPPSNHPPSSSNPATGTTRTDNLLSSAAARAHNASSRARNNPSNSNMHPLNSATNNTAPNTNNNTSNNLNSSNNNNNSTAANRNRPATNRPPPTATPFYPASTTTTPAAAAAATAAVAASSPAAAAADLVRTPVATTNHAIRFRSWRENHVPLLYDWLSSRRTVWPHSVVQFDPAASTDHSSTFSSRLMYLADRTDSSPTDPNTICQYSIRIPHPLTTRPTAVARAWFDTPAAAAASDASDLNAPARLQLRRRLDHPGEVNRLKLLAPGLAVTHTDSPHLFVWNLASAAATKPLATLCGHSDRADYALDVAGAAFGGPGSSGNNNSSNSGPREQTATSASSNTGAPAPQQDRGMTNAHPVVASGGSDAAVLVWNIPSAPPARLQPTVSMRGGHKATVDDVSFRIGDANILASGGRDKSLLIWDVRAPNRPAGSVRAHEDDVNAVDFGGSHGNCIASAGSDKVVRVWDWRQLTQGSNADPRPLHELRGHTDEVNNVTWNRHVPGVLASGAEDGEVLVWRVGDQRTNAMAERGIGRLAPQTASSAPSEHLIFRHVGHMVTQSKICDIHWLPDETDPWCIASISEATGKEGGSVLQVWRMSDLVYRGTADLVEEINEVLDNKP